MWTVLKLLAVLSTALVAGSNSPVQLDAGSELPLHIMTFGLTVERCFLITPTGDEVEFYPEANFDSKYKDTSTPVSKCSVAVKLESSDSGEWILKLVTNNGIFEDGPHNIIITGAAESEISEIENGATGSETNEIIDLDPIIFNTPWGAGQEVSIQTSVLDGFINSCHILSPNGEEHNVTYDLETSGIIVKVVDHQECAVMIDVMSEKFIGNWTLYTKESRYSSNAVERRLNFTIYVEVFVDASPSEIAIARDGIIHFRLANPIDNYDSCTVFGPQGNICQNAVRDTNNKEYCGFSLPPPPHRDEGTWEIRYGNKIVHRALVNVTILDHDTTSSTVYLTLGDTVNKTVGPESVAYCILKDLFGNVVFDGFGNCQLTISRVAYIHYGIWTMSVALPGQVVTSEQELLVVVQEPEAPPEVTTSVVTDSASNSVSILCSVTVPDVVRVCKLRSPDGAVLLSAQGVGDEKYSFFGNGSTYNNGVYHHECGLRIKSPADSELGLWRCALDTDAETYYGFFSVPSPVDITDPETVAAIQTEPTLVAARGEYDALVGETVFVLCSVPAPVQYCYFRASNGTVYNLAPGVAEGSLSYWGGGLRAGECGARVAAASGDAGAWRCAAGTSRGELQASFNLKVEEPMRVSQQVRGNRLEIEAQLHYSLTVQTLEYCRFVRIDGLGFMSTNTPPLYADASVLERGVCGLVVRAPSVLDLHPWVVVAKVRGHDEMVAVTPNLFQQTHYSSTYYFSVLMVFILIGVLLTAILAASLFGTNKRRQRTRSTAVHIRDSFRRGFQRISLKKTNAAA